MNQHVMHSESGRCGRGIYFFHDSCTTLPVRDITGRKKDEPHIEYGLKQGENDGRIVGAENYCSRCYPAVIEKLDENDEDYLFLITHPKHSDIGQKENMVVGYIQNEEILDRVEKPKSVVGETKLYKFADAIPIREFGKRPKGPLGKWGKTFDQEETEEILTHFAGCDDVTKQCLEKTLELKEEGTSREESYGSC